MQAARILVVDDDPAIRQTLPEILTQHGFKITAAATVTEALSQIASTTFDVLVSDLNIGEPGDGFTVVSAMRRTQPDCITLILTGYPAFETALQAIRGQVDDYLVKPAPVPHLVNAIEQKLRSAEPKSHRLTATKRISEVIRQNIDEIVRRTLIAIKAAPEFAEAPLTDEQRIFPHAPLLAGLADLLDSPEPNHIQQGSASAAARRGQIRRSQGYSIPMIVASARLLENAIFEVVGENLLTLEISFVISDLRRLSGGLSWQLEESIKAYYQAGRRLVFDSSEKWSGWFCERCCWNRPVPLSESKRVALAGRINADFNAHNCEAFARQHHAATQRRAQPLAAL
jgi:ActR/RegA family two-component response regulator